MNEQPNNHSIREVATMAAPQIVLPAVIEQTAKRVFESFSEKVKQSLNGRQDRALKLALDGHVTHKAQRIFNVRSEDDRHSYLVDLDKSFCTCPDSFKGNACKHRLAAYLIEQAMLVAPVPTVSEDKPTPSSRITWESLEEAPLTHDAEAIEKARLVLEARSQFLRDAIIYAKLSLNGQFIQVEIITLDGDMALVRALPRLHNGELVPQFPFNERQAAELVIAKSLTDVRIYR